MDIKGGVSAPGTPVIQWIQNHSNNQDVSFETVGDVVYIRSHAGNLYVTVNVPANGDLTPPPGGFAIRTDVLNTLSPGTLKPAYQQWKLTPFDPTGVDKTTFVVSSVLFPNKILVGPPASGGRLFLTDKPATVSRSQAWTIVSPALKN